MNDQDARIIAAATHLEAQRLEMKRRMDNDKQVQHALAFAHNAGLKGLMQLFPGLGTKKVSGK